MIMLSKHQVVFGLYINLEKTNEYMIFFYYIDIKLYLASVLLLQVSKTTLYLMGMI